MYIYIIIYIYMLMVSSFCHKAIALKCREKTTPDWMGNLCVRGSRVKWISAVHMDDGAGLPTSAYVEFVCAFSVRVCMHVLECVYVFLFYDIVHGYRYYIKYKTCM